MVRPVSLILVLLAVVVGPIWWFESRTQQRQPTRPPVQPLAPSMADGQNRSSVFSQAGFSSGTSPAVLPSSGQPNPIGNETYNRLDTAAPFPAANNPNDTFLFPPQANIPNGAETLVFPGNERGPDLTAQPLTYMPISNWAEIFRFDVHPDWVKQRWNRVSSSPVGADYTGLRIPLVTGGNLWDLHGSLTYYFDRSKNLQRISFRGWTGDANSLSTFLNSQYELAPQETGWAGAMLAYRTSFFERSELSGLILQNPPVIRQDQPWQRFAVILELNRPDGSLSLSQEFRQLYRQRK